MIATYRICGLNAVHVAGYRSMVRCAMNFDMRGERYVTYVFVNSSHCPECMYWRDGLLRYPNLYHRHSEVKPQKNNLTHILSRLNYGSKLI